MTSTINYLNPNHNIDIFYLWYNCIILLFQMNILGIKYTKNSYFIYYIKVNYFSKATYTLLSTLFINEITDIWGTLLSINGN